jgi:hypothetical protein
MHGIVAWTSESESVKSIGALDRFGPTRSAKSAKITMVGTVSSEKVSILDSGIPDSMQKSRFEWSCMETTQGLASIMSRQKCKINF